MRRVSSDELAAARTLAEDILSGDPAEFAPDGVAVSVAFKMGLAEGATLMSAILGQALSAESGDTSLYQVRIGILTKNMDKLYEIQKKDKKLADYQNGIRTAVSVIACMVI